MLVCAITNYFFNEGKLEYGEYARAGQYAENVYWKKTGLMDQMACAAGDDPSGFLSGRISAVRRLHFPLRIWAADL